MEQATNARRVWIGERTSRARNKRTPIKPEKTTTQENHMAQEEGLPHQEKTKNGTRQDNLPSKTKIKASSLSLSLSLSLSPWALGETVAPALTWCSPAQQQQLPPRTGPRSFEDRRAQRVSAGTWRCSPPC